MERNEIEPLLTIEDLRKILNISERSIRYHMNRDGLPFVKLGRTLRFKRADVERWVEARTYSQTDRNAA